MSATDLIEQVAALPEREKARFEELFLAMKNGNRAHAPAKLPTWPDFGERLHRIYRGKMTSDSQEIINEGRGNR